MSALLLFFNADVQDLRLTFVSGLAALEGTKWPFLFQHLFFSCLKKKVSVRAQLTAGSRFDIGYHCVFNRLGRSSLQPELPSPNLENSPCSFTPWLMLVLQGKYAGVMMFHTLQGFLITMRKPLTYYRAFDFSSLDAVLFLLQSARLLSYGAQVYILKRRTYHN